MWDVRNVLDVETTTPFSSVLATAICRCLFEYFSVLYISSLDTIIVLAIVCRKDIIGLILAKEMVLVDPMENVYVRDMRTRDLPRLSADTPMCGDSYRNH